MEKKYSFVSYVGFIPDDELKEELTKWTYFLNPVLWYSRGASTKLAQAISMGVPVLSTPAGNRGYCFEQNSIPTFETIDDMVKFISENIENSDINKLLHEKIMELALNGPNLKSIFEMNQLIKL